MKNNTPHFLYLFTTDEIKMTNFSTTRKCKIGITDNLTRRKKQVMNGYGSAIKLEHHITLNSRQEARNLENTFHDLLRYQRAYGEWFYLEGIDQAIIKALKEMEDFEYWQSTILHEYWVIKTGQLAEEERKTLSEFGEDQAA